LWAFLYYLGESVGRVVILKYSDVSGGYITLAPKGRLKGKHLPVPRPVSEMLRRRRKVYPDDTFIFQSHSNRIGTEIKPVTVIAFNTALKRASAGVTHKNISSKKAISCR
jgi:integrase